MGDAAEQRILTYDAYLALERATGLRHQQVDGVAYAMAGGTPEHGLIAANLIELLAPRMRAHGCRLFPSDVKVFVHATGNTYYPALSLVCGPVERARHDANAITNPIALVEVLSPSTEAEDRGRKALDYRKIPSLRHYLIVAQDTRHVEHRVRGDDGVWRILDLGPGDAIRIEGEAIPVDAVYRALDLAEAPT